MVGEAPGARASLKTKCTHWRWSRSHSVEAGGPVPSIAAWTPAAVPIASVATAVAQATVAIAQATEAIAQASVVAAVVALGVRRVSVSSVQDKTLSVSVSECAGMLIYPEQSV